MNQQSGKETVRHLNAAGVQTVKRIIFRTDVLILRISNHAHSNKKISGNPRSWKAESPSAVIMKQLTWLSDTWEETDFDLWTHLTASSLTWSIATHRGTLDVPSRSPERDWGRLLCECIRLTSVSNHHIHSHKRSLSSGFGDNEQIDDLEAGIWMRCASMCNDWQENAWKMRITTCFSESWKLWINEINIVTLTSAT